MRYKFIKAGKEKWCDLDRKTRIFYFAMVDTFPPGTTSEIASLLEYDKQTVRNWIRECKDAGLVEVL